MTDKGKDKKKRQSNAEKPISLRPLEFDEAVADILQVKPIKAKENTNSVMPECRMCGHRRPAGRYLVVVDVGGRRQEISEYVCNPCWRLLNKGGRKGHFFRATGQHWWLYQHHEHLE